MRKSEIEDSWIFLSIVRSSGQPLSFFYAAADFINVAIPLDDEIERSVNRLMACGLVIVEDNSFSITPKGQMLFQKIKKLSASPRPQVLLAVPLLSKAMQTEVSQTPWRFDPNIASDARQEYFKWIQEKKVKSRKRKPEDAQR